MRILIISDIHANLTALDAVLASAGDVDGIWCLGDLVGYGPDPNECISRLHDRNNFSCIMGNHDAAAMELIDTQSFNLEARRAIEITQHALSDASRAYLSSLPEKLTFGQVTLSHGSPRHPVWEYLLDAHTALINFDYFKTDFCFVGHTHLPVQYSLHDGWDSVRLSVPRPEQVISLGPRAILNPGSVGQPRDRNPRASFAIFDPDRNTWTNHRVVYDISSVQERMETLGMPARHIQRLAAGW